MRPKKIIAIAISAVLLPLSFATPVNASIFGEENIALSQILFQNIKQLIELQKILKNGKDTLGLLEEVNQGIRDCLSILDTLNVHIEPGVFSDVRKIEEIYRKIEEIYGKIPNTPSKETQIMHDQSVAEAMQMHNDLYQYSAQLDQEGEQYNTAPKSGGRSPRLTKMAISFPSRKLAENYLMASASGIFSRIRNIVASPISKIPGINFLICKMPKGMCDGIMHMGQLCLSIFLRVFRRFWLSRPRGGQNHEKIILFTSYPAF